MLITLHHDLADSIGDRPLDPKLKVCLDVLLLAAKEGKHALICPRNVCRVLWANRSLRLRLGNTLVQLRNRAAELQAYRQRVTSEIIVTPQAEGAVECSTIARRTTYRVPYGWFDDSSRIQAAIVLAEGEPDARLYESVSHAYGLQLFSWAAAFKRVRAA